MILYVCWMAGGLQKRTGAYRIGEGYKMPLPCTCTKWMPSYGLDNVTKLLVCEIPVA